MVYIGFWVKRDGVKPINTKIEARTNMVPHFLRKEVRKFIGVINYYRDMCPRRSHTLVSLPKLTFNKRKCKWTKVEQYIFDEIKRIVARDTLLTYPDFYEAFKIHTDVSAFQ